MSENEITFRAKPVRCVYDSGNFKVYGCEIDKNKYPDVKMNVYRNVSICGDLPNLAIGTEYEISAKEEDGKYGTSYRVQYIQRDVPETKDGIFAFLQEILTQKQATVVYSVYPDIIDRVRNNRLDDIDLNKLDGIGEYRFEKIKHRIVENFALADIISEFKGVLTKSMAMKIHNRYTSVDQFKKELKKDPYAALTSISGVGFKTSDTLILKMQDENAFDFGYRVASSRYRCLSCVMYLLDDNENGGSTKASMADIRKKCISLVPECIDEFENVLEHDKIHYDQIEMTMALEGTYNHEKHIACEIISKINNRASAWEYDVEKYRSIDGIDLSDEQMKFLSSVCNNNITLLTAPAGAGKSQATKAVINMLEDNGKTYKLMSPTGKAAMRLSEYTGREAYTIHKILSIEEDIEEEHGILDVDVIIIDEVGMVSVDLFSRLLYHLNNYTKIVLIGDEYQLNSIGCGALLRDLANSDIVPKVEFTKVFRMGEGGCLTACTYVRQNKRFISKNKPLQLGKDKSYTFVPTSKEDMNEKIVALYKSLIKKVDPSDITVISSFNIGESGCDKLNKILQPIANPNANAANEHVSFGKGDKEVNYYVGDSVIQIKNKYGFDKRLQVANGERGVIECISNDGDSVVVLIRFDNACVAYKKKDLQNNIKHSFALSTHKMQGSQNKIIIFCCPSSHFYFLSNNIIYTAISRAEKAVFHLGDAKTVNAAMSKSDVENRKTYLGDMLRLCGGVDV